jgi:hypothetical protein
VLPRIKYGPDGYVSGLKSLLKIILRKITEAEMCAGIRAKMLLEEFGKNKDVYYVMR